MAVLHNEKSPWKFHPLSAIWCIQGSNQNKFSLYNLKGFILLVLLIKMESKRKVINWLCFVYFQDCRWQLFFIYMTSSDHLYIVFRFFIGDKKSMFKPSLGNKTHFSEGSWAWICGSYFFNVLNSSLRIYLNLKRVVLQCINQTMSFF